MSQHDVAVDCVRQSSLIRAVFIAPDPSDAVKRYGAGKRLNSVLDDKITRRVNKFFDVAGYKFTSISDQTCWMKEEVLPGNVEQIIPTQRKSTEVASVLLRVYLRGLSAGALSSGNLTAESVRVLTLSKMHYVKG